MPNQQFPARTSGRLRRWITHLYRWAAFVVIIGLIHAQHQWYRAQQAGKGLAVVTIEQLQKFYPSAAELADFRPGQGGQTVVDAADEILGYIVRTSPESDSIIGYSGPTNCLIAFTPQNQVLGFDVIRSGDTPEHLEAVLQDELFMRAFNGLSWQQAAQKSRVDAVSGATLTSMAIAEGISRRLGGAPHSCRFPDPIEIEEISPFFSSAHRLIPGEDKPGLFDVVDADENSLGSVFRTSPAADDLIGYQGPTDTLIALDTEQSVTGIAVHASYETPEYVGYIRDDEYFLTLFNGKTLLELAELDLEEDVIEGVSGATMTSQTMALAMAQAAAAVRDAQPPPVRPAFAIATRDVGTILVVLFACVLAFTSLRSNRSLRVLFQISLIVYLGFIHGDMVSQALIVGWAQSGVPWRFAAGLVFLVAAALLVPLTTRRQVYCHHICPHGAVQQLIKNVVPRKPKLPRWLTRGLSVLPWLLLLVVVIVAMRNLPFNLASLEPFDAYIYRVAGWASISIALIGVAFSLLVPMGYCRYGCPTGAMLNFLRLQGRNDRFGVRDWMALVLVVVAMAFYWFK